MKKEGSFIVPAGSSSITLPAAFFPTTPNSAHAYFGDVNYPACSDFPSCTGQVACSGIPGDTDYVSATVSGGNVTISWSCARQRNIAYYAQ